MYDAEDEVRALNSRYEELINMAKVLIKYWK